jgi:hypothetical protein
MLLKDFFTEQDRRREDEWAAAKWEGMVRYVRRLSTADKKKWAERQTESTKNRMREALANESNKLKTQ